MPTALMLFLAVLGAGAAQTPKQSVYLTSRLFENAGPLGPEFIAAIKRALQRSPAYAPVSTPDVPKGGILFHMHVVVNCQSGDCLAEGKAMAFVNVETLGRAAWPLPDHWYDKVFVVRRRTVDQAAGRLLADVAAFWCGMSHYNSKAAMAACPKELLPAWPPGFF